MSLGTEKGQSLKKETVSMDSVDSFEQLLEIIQAF